MTIMSDFINSVKVLIHLSAFLFPKYPWYYFCCYMILQYSKIQLKRKHFNIKAHPETFIKSLLKGLPIKSSLDVNNCVLVKSHRFVATFAKLYQLKNPNSKSRFVQIFEINNRDIKNDEILLTDTLHYNLKNVNRIGSKLNIKFSKPSEATLASEAELAQVNIFCDIPSDVIDTVLKQYFATPRLLCINDIISVNVKEYAAQHYITNKQVNGIKTIYFKCKNARDSESVNPHDCFVCVSDDSSLKLSSNVQSFIPKTTELVADNYTLDCCVYGLTDYFADLKASIKPFLTKGYCNNALL